MSELNIVEKVLALEAVELLNKLTPDQLARIATIAKEIRFAPGKTIVEPDKPLEALYVVLDGAVEMKRGVEILTVAKQNDVIGTWALFDPEPLPVGAATIEDTRLLRIGRDDFYDLLSDNTEIMASVFTALVRRFRQLVQQ